MKNIAIIPARGGSKGVPGKNLRLVAGVPLVVHTIRDALRAEQISEVYVSTDDPEIAAVAEAEGASVIERPAKISGDFASSESAIAHALKTLSHGKDLELPDTTVFLQCTSPIRDRCDIDKALDTFYAESADSLLSVVHTHRFHWNIVEGRPESINYDFKHRKRRQDCVPTFTENGSIYIFRSNRFLVEMNRLFGKISLHFMSTRTLYEVDEEIDLKIIETLLSEK